MPNHSLISVIRALRSGRRSDFNRLAKLSAGYLLTLLLPSRVERWALGRLGRTPLGVREGRTGPVEDRMRQVLGPFLPDSDFHSMAVDYCRMAREIQWLRIRAFHTTDIPAETPLVGIERIRDSQKEGVGVILWGMSFCETLPVKVALHRAGVRLVHLSAAIHGVPYPHTQLGLQLVGPFYSSAENPFLGERVVIPADGSLRYLRLLKDRLSGNSCVYIRGDRRSDRTNVIAPLFGREVKFARGAPALSWQMGSPLLPIHVIREGPLRYRTVIHPPIEADRGRDKHHFVHSAVRDFAELLESCALESPSSWDLSSVFG